MHDTKTLLFPVSKKNNKQTNKTKNNNINKNNKNKICASPAIV